MKPHHKEKCPKCSAAVMVDMIDADDGVRRVGCKICDEWSAPCLSNYGALRNLRLKMFPLPAPEYLSKQG